MTPALWGVLCGAGVGGGVLLVWSRVAVIRHPQLGLRVLPYLRDVPTIGPVPGLRASRPARRRSHPRAALAR